MVSGPPFLLLFFWSAKSDSYELTLEMKEEYKKAFDALDNNKKWVLDDGRKVEDAIPVHSFILDTRDKCWESVFTPSQLEQIDSGKKALCEYSESCKNIFSALSQTIIDANKRVPPASSSSSSAGVETTTTTTIIGDGKEEEGRKSSYLKLAIKEEDLISKLWKRLAELGMINPCQDYDLHWLQRTMNYILDLYRMIETTSTLLTQGQWIGTSHFRDNEERASAAMSPIAAKVPVD
ncbi:hypothetical protein INT45_008465 [Circinella minor]|uniref:Uncharacterized protein n=1 Tax=Circinella minor TaxID=1195481 RepID=A0A8H7SFD0_9FUNG|nr:hypothetical protein INT45_008465 [Circinella minor]